MAFLLSYAMIPCLSWRTGGVGVGDVAHALVWSSPWLLETDGDSRSDRQRTLIALIDRMLQLVHRSFEAHKQKNAKGQKNFSLSCDGSRRTWQPRLMQTGCCCRRLPQKHSCTSPAGQMTCNLDTLRVWTFGDAVFVLLLLQFSHVALPTIK